MFIEFLDSARNILIWILVTIFALFFLVIAFYFNLMVGYSSAVRGAAQVEISKMRLKYDSGYYDESHTNIFSQMNGATSMKDFDSEEEIHTGTKLEYGKPFKLDITYTMPNAVKPGGKEHRVIVRSTGVNRGTFGKGYSYERK